MVRSPDVPGRYSVMVKQDEELPSHVTSSSQSARPSSSRRLRQSRHNERFQLVLWLQRCAVRSGLKLRRTGRSCSGPGSRTGGFPLQLQAGIPCHCITTVDRRHIAVSRVLRRSPQSVEGRSGGGHAGSWAGTKTREVISEVRLEAGERRD